VRSPVDILREKNAGKDAQKNSGKFSPAPKPQESARRQEPVPPRAAQENPAMRETPRPVPQPQDNGEVSHDVLARVLNGGGSDDL
jgi:hypothetical protein